MSSIYPMKKHLSTIGLLAILSLGAAVTARASSASEIWMDSCASCHGKDGKADTKMGKKLHVKDYTDAASLAKMTDVQLTDAIAKGVVAEGKERMKGFAKELSADDIKLLVQYSRDFSKK